jgi:hypothetical protein
VQIGYGLSFFRYPYFQEAGMVRLRHKLRTRLIVVMALLVAIALPVVLRMVTARKKEAVLRADLAQLRNAIEHYHAEKNP